MNEKKLYLLMSLALVMLVPIPARFAFGILIVLEMILLNFFGICFRRLLDKISLNKVKTVLMVLFYVSFAIVYRQFLNVVFPFASFVLSFAMYIPVLSNFMLYQAFKNCKRKFNEEIKSSFRPLLYFCLLAILIFAVRDLIAYGTVSLPSPSGILELFKIQKNYQGSSGVFWGSMAGGLVIVAVICSIGIYVHRQFEKIRMSEVKE